MMFIVCLAQPIILEFKEPVCGIIHENIAVVGDKV